MRLDNGKFHAMFLVSYNMLFWIQYIKRSNSNTNGLLKMPELLKC